MSEYQSTFSIPGISSQIDWGAMADKLMEKARKPQEQWVTQRDTLELKIGLFNEFSASLKSLRSAVTPLKLESVFKAKAAEFTVISGLNAPSVVTATVDAGASIARHEIEVIRKAAAETRFSNQITTTMGAAGLDGTKTFSINVGGRRADIQVLTTDSLHAIAQKINAAKDATINPATGQAYGEGIGVTATVIDNRLVLRSSNTGLGTNTSDWEITRGTGDKDRLGFTAVGNPPAVADIVVAGPKITSHTITRNALGNDDDLGFTVDATPPANGKITISGYTENTDFTVSGSTITWIGNKPADGATYDVSYRVEASVYKQGTHFELTEGSDEIEWLSADRPALATKYTVAYTADSNVFTISGGTDPNDPISILGLNATGAEHRIEAQDAQFKIDGLTITRSSNQIDDLLDGVKLSINGPGKVIMDITQDAEKAVTGVKDFVTSFNDVLDWINIRLTESKQEKSTDSKKSDDFFKKFGLLHGNSMLWQSKSQLRMLMTNPIEAKYTKKTGNAILGTMAAEGVTSNSTFELTVGVRTARIEVTPSDTLSSIASKINNSYEMLHDPQGRTYPIPMASAKVVNNQLVIESSPNRQFSLKATDDILDKIGLGSPFSLLSQIGISTEKADFGKSGKLEFNTDKFMAALTKDPDGVAAIMNTLMANTDEYIGNMVDATPVEVGTATTPKGRVASQVSMLQSEIKVIDKRIVDFERRLEVRSRGLYDSFAKAEVRLAKLQQQASWLSSVISQLNAKTASTS